MSDIDFIGQAAHAAACRYPWYATLIQEGTDGSLPPLLTRSLLERHLYAKPSADAPDASLSVYRTSGTSTGIRKTIFYSATDEQRYIGIKAELFQNWLHANGGNMNNAPVHNVMVDMGTGHAAATALEVFARIGLDAQALPFTLPIDQHLQRIEKFCPELIYTMPSILDRIVRRADQPHKLGIRKVILVGEVVTPAWQRQIVRRLGIAPNDLLDTYGSIEIGTIAAYSHELGRYVLADGLHAEGVLAESLGEGFEPLPPDERVLVLTSMVRESFPAVRYVTYDVVRDLRTDRIGGTERQTFASIVKRIGPELKHGEKISLYDIEEAVLQLADDAAVRLVVKDRRVMVQLSSRKLTQAGLPAVRNAIEARIPEIGTMIGGGLLERIDITLIPSESEQGGAVGHEGNRSIKDRKIHYETPDLP